MSVSVCLDDIVEALESAGFEVHSFVDKETGEVLTLQNEFLSMAEDENSPRDNLPAWQRPVLEEARRVVEQPDRFAHLLTQYDIHEWEIMREFANEIDDERIGDELARALHGKGAFRYFKDTLHRHGIQDQWYEYRDEALRQLAIEWCEENGFAYHRKKAPGKS